jgi:hypothetical protein
LLNEARTEFEEADRAASALERLAREHDDFTDSANLGDS